MSVTNKVKALLNITGSKPQELSQCLGISVQAVRNKFSRDSFSVGDLIKISDFLGCELQFKTKDSQLIVLTPDDIKRTPPALDE